MTQWQQRALSELNGIKAMVDYPMAELTTFKIGGPVDLLVEPLNIEQLQRVMRYCQDERLSWKTLGLGSNLLVRDKGIRGVVIKLGGIFKEWRVEETQVTAGAAVSLSELSRAMAQYGLVGLEFACGIPGSVGGAIYMNAGAYDGEISQVLTKVEAVDPKRGLVRYQVSEMEYGYRKSRFQNSNEVIATVVFDLQRGEKTKVGEKIADLTHKRESKQPLEMPSAGSVFRRPEGYYVGPLIEEAGLKGFQIGGAQVSPKHAGFIVNAGGAKAQDVIDLIEHIRKVIREKNGVDLTPEIKIVGEE